MPGIIEWRCESALEAVAGFHLPQVHLRQVPQGGPEPESAMDLRQEIHGADPTQVPLRVRPEHDEVEPVDVEPHDPVGHHQVQEEPVHLGLAVRAVAASLLVVHHGEGEAHPRDLRPASDLVGAALGLDVEEEHPLPHARHRRRGGRRAPFGPHGARRRPSGDPVLAKTLGSRRLEGRVPGELRHRLELGRGLLQ